MLLESAVRVREAFRTDLPRIVEIYNASIPSLQSTGDLEPIAVESRLGWFQEHSTQQYPIWVAEVEAQVIGWISLQLFYGRLAYRKTAEVSLYISPDYQGQGVGTLLLHQAIQTCPSLEITTLIGFIFAHNAPSLRLFEKMGFQRWGYLPEVAQMEDTKRDLVILGLQIPKG
jgi:phosphinothricin acetyltransferase